MVKRFVAFWVCMTCVLVIPNAMATNGYFAHGYGTKNKGMAGAGVALPQDTIAAATNPAGMVHLGERFDGGLAIFSPRRDYESSASQANGTGGAFTLGPDDIQSDRNYFPVPHVGYNYPLDSKSSLGVMLYANGGMNTVWNEGSSTFDPDGPGPNPTETFPGTYGAGVSGVDLAQLFLAITYSRKVNEQLSVGISPVLAVQAFRVKGLSSFAGYTEEFVRSEGGNAAQRSDRQWQGFFVRLRSKGWGSLEPDILFGYWLGISVTDFHDRVRRLRQLVCRRG